MSLVFFSALKLGDNGHTVSNYFYHHMNMYSRILRILKCIMQYTNCQQDEEYKLPSIPPTILTA